MNQENPPPSNLPKLREAQFEQASIIIFAITLFISFLLSLRYPSWFLSFFIGIILLTMVFVLKQKATEIQKLKNPVPLNPFEEEIPLTLKTGTSLTLKIVFQLPTDNDNFYNRKMLRVAAQMALAHPFSELDQIPKLSDIDQILAIAFEPVYNELNLSLLRYKTITSLIDTKPPDPPLGPYEVKISR